jgi:hypothetical protein
MWAIGLDDWLIQDGTYDVLSVGQEVRFALEFLPQTIGITSSPGLKTATHVKWFEYEIGASIEFSNETDCILDFGIRAIGPRLYLPGKDPASTGIRGTILLIADSQVRFADSTSQQLMANLAYLWKIERIGALMVLDSDAQPPVGAGLVSADENELVYRELRETRVSPQTDRFSTFLLHCTVIHDT